MSTTHQQIVKVWIAPGCIVCDACESDCPEVFDVQEETCLIRPEAQNAEFTKPLTPSIITAAEGCPVEVIKFETITVEGPAPWEGKEQEAAAAGAPAAGGGGGAKKAASWAPPEGPPDPQWATLLKSARISHRGGDAQGNGHAEVSAKPDAQAIASALPRNAPADALAAAMVGTGFTKPRASATDRIRKTAAAATAAASATRREFNLALAVGWGAIAAIGGIAGGALQSFMAPRVTKEPPSTFRAGKIGDYPVPGVYTQWMGEGIWIVHLTGGKVVAISTTCTHLGCIPNWLANDQKFKCPCHGSGFTVEGINFEGPAPRPLERYAIRLEGDVLIVDKSQKFRQELGQWEDGKSYLTI